MKKIIAILAIVGLLTCVQTVSAQEQTKDTTEIVENDTITADSAMAVIDADLQGMEAELEGEGGGLHKQLKRKFIEGSAGFMSLVALALVLGLAFCIERIIYLTLSEVKTKKLMHDIDERLEKDDVDGAKELCRNTRGPVASICYQGLRNGDWYGDGLRPYPDRRRHQSNDCCCRYEGCLDYYHLWYHRCRHPPVLLQLYSLEDRAPHSTDGGGCYCVHGLCFLAEVMLWLMYIAMGVAVVATIVSAIRSFWLNK